MYIGEEICSKLIPTWVISCIDYIYFQKVPQVGIHNMWMGGSTSTFWSIYIHLNNFLVPSMLCVCVYSFVEVWWIFLWKIKGLICGNLVDPRNLVDPLMGGVAFASKFASIIITFYIPSSSAYCLVCD
jgi:hypothetical protein